MDDKLEVTGKLSERGVGGTQDLSDRQYGNANIYNRTLTNVAHCSSVASFSTITVKLVKILRADSQVLTRIRIASNIQTRTNKHAQFVSH